MKLSFKYKGKQFSFGVKYTEDCPFATNGTCAIYANAALSMNFYSYVKNNYSFNRRLSKEAARKIFLMAASNAGQIYIDHDLHELKKEEQLGVLLHESGHAYYNYGEEESDSLAINVVGEKVFVSALEKIYLKRADDDIVLAKAMLKYDIENEYSHRKSFRWKRLA